MAKLERAPKWAQELALPAPESWWAQSASRIPCHVRKRAFQPGETSHIYGELRKWRYRVLCKRSFIWTAEGLRHLQMPPFQLMLNEHHHTLNYVSPLEQGTKVRFDNLPMPVLVAGVTDPGLAAVIAARGLRTQLQRNIAHLRCNARQRRFQVYLDANDHWTFQAIQGGPA